MRVSAIDGRHQVQCRQGHHHAVARIIYKYALDHLPKDRTQLLFKAYTIHEKYGDWAGIKDVIVPKHL
ncbi:protein crooked neck-like [Drosophila serrata]|uniref:protein crooked neck-like n=1 Tax=Drosophila serrata TaxID=7274 RepID=UPI000A1D24D0|nr:protein crooked neck-like [Drosophila serrata]